MVDGYPFAYVVSPITADLGLLTFGVRYLTYNSQCSGSVIVLCLYIGKAIDAGDDLGGVLAQAVQDYP